MTETGDDFQPRILIIDDERGPRESIRILLKNECEVQCAESVDEGIAVIKERRPDLVILDIRMPGKSGIDGLKEIREIDTEMSVVMLTGFGALETAQQAMRLGANDYLNKPFDTEEMRAVVRKYTARSRVERRRREMLGQLHDVNQRLLADLAGKEQMASIGQSSAEFAHDLRNPLMIISGYVELLVKHIEKARDHLGDDFGQASAYLDVIGQNVQRCYELSDMWRKYGKQQISEFKLTRTEDLMKDIVDSIEPLASTEGVRMTYELELENATLWGSRPQLIRAIHNIVSNAIQAVPETSGAVVLAAKVVDERVDIAVTDNGCGMPQDVLDHIFEPYFTTKDESEGTGLGMVITKKIVEEHKGAISVTSEPGKGTTVRISLPLATESETVVEAPSSS